MNWLRRLTDKFTSMNSSAGDTSDSVKRHENSDIITQLENHGEYVRPITSAAKSYLNQPSILAEGEILRIANRPWRGEFNYAFTLFPGISREELHQFCNRFELSIPETYVNFLTEFNGAFCMGMSLCGIPKSMLQDRKSLLCHSLITANTHWSREYQISNELFHFGGRHFSYQENVGYFIEKDKRILSAKKNGEVVRIWSTFSEFLSDELSASEKLEAELHPQK